MIGAPPSSLELQYSNRPVRLADEAVDGATHNLSGVIEGKRHFVEDVAAEKLSTDGRMPPQCLEASEHVLNQPLTIRRFGKFLLAGQISSNCRHQFRVDLRRYSETMHQLVNQ